MPKKNWTEEERKAFGEKMKAAREAKEPQKEMTVEEKIADDYQHGAGIFLLAHRYNVEIDEVYHAIGMDDMTQVRTMGDMEDRGIEGRATANPYGTTFPIQYTKN